MSALRRRISSFLQRAIGNRTRRSPTHRVTSAESGFSSMSRPVSVATKTPPGLTEPRHRSSDCLPTASTTTSYVSPFFVKSCRW